MPFPFPTITLEVLIETFNNRYSKMTLTSDMSALLAIYPAASQ